MRFSVPIHLIEQQDNFSPTEVGLTHPEMPSFMRLRDNGDVEIVAGEGLSIVMHSAKKSITFEADDIKFLTRKNGLRWNKLAFNDQAIKFNEPTFLMVNTKDKYGLYSDVDYYLGEKDDEENDETIINGRKLDRSLPVPNFEVTDPETGETILFAQYVEKYGSQPSFGEKNG